MKTYNIALIGTGMIYKSHLAAIANLENARCVAVSDVVEEKARSAAQEGGCAYYTDVEKMLAAQPEIDLCIIATPTFTHAPLVELCCKYNKAIMCEKPLEMNAAEGRRIKKAVEQSGVTYMTAQVVRFWMGYTEIKRMMAAGEFGEIYMGYFSRCSQRQFWGNSWLFDPKRGGGAMHDMMVHDIDYMNYLFGPAKRVFTLASKDDTMCYENVFASIEYKNGCKAVAETSFTMREGYPFTMSAKIMGSKATVEFVYAAGFDINQRDGANISMRVFKDGEAPRVFVPPVYDAYTKQLEYFLGCMEKGVQPDVIHVDDSIDVIRTIEAIEKSADTGSVVELD